MTYESKLKKAKSSRSPITILACTNCGSKCSSGCGNECKDTCDTSCARECRINVGMYSTNNLEK